MASKTEKGVLAKALKKADAVLKEMVGMTLRSDLTRIQRISLETCITVHMHQKESTGVCHSGHPRPHISQYEIHGGMIT